jgi:hypothetical protein
MPGDLDLLIQQFVFSFENFFIYFFLFLQFFDQSLFFFIFFFEFLVCFILSHDNSVISCDFSLFRFFFFDDTCNFFAMLLHSQDLFMRLFDKFLVFKILVAHFFVPHGGFSDHGRQMSNFILIFRNFVNLVQNQFFAVNYILLSLCLIH